MKINRLLILIAISIFGLACNRTSIKKSDSIEFIMSGDYAKVWVWKTDDTLDCHCYYEIVFKSGQMKHMRRDRYSGVFIDYFNNLSGDVINNENEWYYRDDTLSLMGYKYKVIEIMRSRDTLVLENFTSLRRYYLIDSKLMDMP